MACCRYLLVYLATGTTGAVAGARARGGTVAEVRVRDIAKV